MSIFNIVTDNGVAIGARYTLSDNQVSLLSSLFHQPSRPASSTLGGRRAVSVAQLDPIGNVVVKHYTRGGIVRHLIDDKYFRWGPTRSQKEFELLQTVRKLGVSAPEPIAYAHQGYPFYRAWLVTREVDRHQTLAQLSLANEYEARRLMEAVCTQVGKLIDHGIWHVDLHPGNILVDPEGRVFLIDFDKARTVSNRWKVKENYLHRWRRAIDKHDLPRFLSHQLAKGIGTATEATHSGKTDHEP